jgi:hypothetical protein
VPQISANHVTMLAQRRGKIKDTGRTSDEEDSTASDVESDDELTTHDDIVRRSETEVPSTGSTTERVRINNNRKSLKSSITGRFVSSKKRDSDSTETATRSASTGRFIHRGSADTNSSDLSRLSVHQILQFRYRVDTFYVIYAEVMWTIDGIRDAIWRLTMSASVHQQLPSQRLILNTKIQKFQR